LLLSWYRASIPKNLQLHFVALGIAVFVVPHKGKIEERKRADRNRGVKNETDEQAGDDSASG